MRRSTALLLTAIAIVAITLWGFQPEAAALAWHVRHGMHADGAGLRVRVPLLYSAIEGDSSLVLMTRSGVLRQKMWGAGGALILISKKIPATQSANETLAEWWNRTASTMTRQGARQTGTRLISIAGRTLRCSEFEGGDFIAGIDIWCVPDSTGGWIVDYTGPRYLVPQFYAALESAQAR